ncbi:hypothetical protein GCM10009610_65710 [Pseudonocardia xinjiangensis]
MVAACPAEAASVGPGVGRTHLAATARVGRGFRADLTGVDQHSTTRIRPAKPHCGFTRRRPARVHRPPDRAALPHCVGPPARTTDPTPRNAATAESAAAPRESAERYADQDRDTGSAMDTSLNRRSLRTRMNLGGWRHR